MEIATEKYDAKTRVFAEQVAHLYSHAALSHSYHVVNGAILVLVLWDYLSAKVLLSWFCSLLVFTFCRALLAYTFYRKQPRLLKIQFWYKAYLFGVGLVGIVWGSAAVFLFPPTFFGPQMFVVFMLAGMAAGAVSVLSARLLAFLLFTVPTLIPLAIQLFIQSDSISHAMGMMTILFLFGMYFAARGVNQTIVTSLNLRFDNRELIIQISKREETERSLFREKERLRITLAALAESVVITDADARLEYLNPAAEKLSGWQNSEAEGQSVSKVFRCINEVTRDTMVPTVNTCLQSGKRTENNTLLLTRCGQEQLLKEIATPLMDSEGKVSGAVVILRNVTRERKRSRELVHQASHDWLTQLPNRALLWNRLNHAIAKASQDDHLVAVLFMDLDRFKEVNDSLGHAAGDALLVEIADLLRASVREGDTVARLGGDEFVVLLENLYKVNQASSIARKIAKNLTVPLVIEGRAISVTFSAGITLFPTHGRNAEILLKKADVAMYSSKEKGRNIMQFFSDKMNPGTTDSNREFKPD